MKFPNTPQLKKWLQRDHPLMAASTEFEVPEERYEAFRKQLHSQGDHKHRDSLKEADALDQVALFAALTYQEPTRAGRAPEKPAVSGTIAPLYIEKTPTAS